MDVPEISPDLLGLLGFPERLVWLVAGYIRVHDLWESSPPVRITSLMILFSALYGSICQVLPNRVPTPFLNVDSLCGGALGRCRLASPRLFCKSVLMGLVWLVSAAFCDSGRWNSSFLTQLEQLRAIRGTRRLGNLQMTDRYL